MLWWLRWELRQLKENWAVRIAKWCPRWLAYRCTIRVGVHATTGKYSSQIVPELTLMDALKRWEHK